MRLLGHPEAARFLEVVDFDDHLADGRKSWPGTPKLSQLVDIDPDAKGLPFCFSPPEFGVSRACLFSTQVVLRNMMVKWQNICYDVGCL